MQAILSRVTAWHLKQAYLTQLSQFTTAKGDASSFELVKRTERAWNILTHEEHYTIEYMSETPMTFHVVSPNDTYTVVPSQQLCTCPDAERSVLCKHRLAVKIILDAIKAMRADGLVITAKETLHV